MLGKVIPQVPQGEGGAAGVGERGLDREIVLVVALGDAVDDGHAADPTLGVPGHAQFTLGVQQVARHGQDHVPACLTARGGR